MGSIPVGTGSRLCQKGAQGESASCRSTMVNSSSTVSRGRGPSAANAPPCGGQILSRLRLLKLGWQ